MVRSGTSSHKDIAMLAAQANIIDKLQDPTIYPHPCTNVELIETHISWVLLTGPRAYKIKKSVDFGFVDFTTLERRRHFCEEEIRLNRRLAPDVYRKVVAITETDGQVAIDGAGQIVDYAVCMKQFDPATVLNRLSLAEITDAQIDGLADRLAEFHDTAAVSSRDEAFGSVAEVLQPMFENYDVLSQVEGCCREMVTDIRARAEFHAERLSTVFQRRKQNGRIRECHGDLHLGNMFLAEDEITVFDGIEFNDSFRWIDVACDLAFLLMDLKDHDQHRLASRLLNRWLERTGDYDALHVLPFYCSYRAAVRAKVDVLRMHQPDVTYSDQRSLSNDCQHYLELSKRFLVRHPPTLSITMGVSGSGKTTVTQRLIESSNTVRIRSDVERKRQHGLKMDEASPEEMKSVVYSANSTSAVYDRLQSLATTVIDAGFSAVVDATFLNRTERQQFSRLAECLGVPFTIIHCEASPDVLKQRIRQRHQHESDASEADEAVLTRQLETMEELTEDECRFRSV